MKKIPVFYFCLLGFFLQAEAFRHIDKKSQLHKLVKRQTDAGSSQDVGRTLTGGPLSGRSSEPSHVYRSGGVSTANGRTIIPRRTFVGSQGRTYRDYQPIVSTSGGGASGGGVGGASGRAVGGASARAGGGATTSTGTRYATSGSGLSGRYAVVDGAVRSSSRTYRYPFGQAAVEYETESGTESGTAGTGSGVSRTYSGGSYDPGLAVVYARGGSSRGQARARTSAEERRRHALELRRRLEQRQQHQRAREAAESGRQTGSGSGTRWAVVGTDSSSSSLPSSSSSSSSPSSFSPPLSSSSLYSII
ncbi:keratin, type I cytoskeletal 9-like [Aplysia californica]|uniref:Keratin, type I cytoskeletal 9-like n=1 Tax=Aplysia californica TaxID=6500 RepID=A0ABM1W1M2_APLCA|nr:keratin, type I cytoskeletal 9-like [Aplysia californica]